MDGYTNSGVNASALDPSYEISWYPNVLKCLSKNEFVRLYAVRLPLSKFVLKIECFFVPQTRI